jgi:hypothetical protein
MRVPVLPLGAVIARRVVALAALLPVCLLSPLAAAAEGEKALGVGIDFATWNVVQEDHPGTEDDSITATGGQLALDYEYGWNDTLWLRGSASGGYFSVPQGSAWSTGATVGITYAVDVLRYVPLVHAGVGALLVGGDGVDVEVKPVVELGVGLAVLEGRTFSWGVVARFDGFASEAIFFTIGPRMTWRWGYF